VLIAQPTAESVILVRQYRYGVQAWTWELPAGTCDPDETWQETARRELREETGWLAQDVQLLQTFWPAPGLTDEVLHVVQAKGLASGNAHPEADEVLAGQVLTRSAVEELLAQGAIQDAKTLIGLAQIAWWPCRP
jgi:ADP-ribose pyrophosphatase